MRGNIFHGACCVSRFQCQREIYCSQLGLADQHPLMRRRRKLQPTSESHSVITFNKITLLRGTTAQLAADLKHVRPSPRLSRRPGDRLCVVPDGPVRRISLPSNCSRLLAALLCTSSQPRTSDLQQFSPRSLRRLGLAGLLPIGPTAFDGHLDRHTSARAGRQRGSTLPTRRAAPARHPPTDPAGRPVDRGPARRRCRSEARRASLADLPTEVARGPPHPGRSRARSETTQSICRHHSCFRSGKQQTC